MLPPAPHPEGAPTRVGARPAGPSSPGWRIPLLGRLLDAAGRAWRFNAELQERRMRALCPWDDEGPLRWRWELGGRRLVGSSLPAPGQKPPGPGLGRRDCER